MPPGAVRGVRAGHTYLGCCRALAPRSGAHPRRSPPHALRGHGARRALRRRPLPHPPSPGCRGVPGGALPSERLCPFTAFLTTFPPLRPCGRFFFSTRESRARRSGKGGKLVNYFFFPCFPGRAERVCAGRDSGDLPEPAGLRAAGCPVMPSGGSPSRNPV